MLAARFYTFSVIVAMVALFASAAWSEETGPVGITVSGQGEAYAVPDIARISAGVMTQDKDAAKAAAENAKLARKIVDAIMSVGVAKKDIQTSLYSVQPMYEHNISAKKLTGYQVSNIVKVTVKDLRKAGDVIDKAIAAGANNVQGPSFELDNDAALRDKALAAAVKAAANKAKVIAGALGVRLGSVRAVSESVGRPIYPMMLVRADVAGAPETPALPGQLAVTATVTLVYNIR